MMPSSSSSRFSWRRVGFWVVPLASMMLVYHISRPQQTTSDPTQMGSSTVELSGSTWWDPITQCILDQEKKNKIWEKRQDVVSILSCVFIKCVKRSVVERCKFIDVCVWVFCFMFLFRGLLVLVNGGLFL